MRAFARSFLVLVSVLFASSIPVYAAEPGADVDNAALKYWQAFSQLPEMKRVAALLETDPGDFADSDIEFVLSTVPVVEAVKSGNACEACDWELDYSKGPFLLLQHVTLARDTAGLIELHARVHFENGDFEKAIDDVAAMITLGRHVADDPIFVCQLIDMSIERKALGVVLEYLGELSPELRGRLLEKMQSAPESASIKETLVRTEKEFMCQWLAKQLAQSTELESRRLIDSMFNIDADSSAGQKVRQLSRRQLIESVEALEEQYEVLGTMLQLPMAEFKSKWHEYFEAQKKKNPVAAFLLPDVEKIRAAVEQTATLRERVVAELKK